MVFNPLLTGITVGLLVDNISLALVAAGLTILIYGNNQRGINWIISAMVILTVLTGNINFEIIFIYFISLLFFLHKASFKHYIRPVLIVSVLSFPCWRYLLGIIPAQLLNQVNIAGELILLTGIILSIKRGLNTDNRVNFLLYFFLGGLGVTGDLTVVPLWIIGGAGLFLLENFDFDLSIPGPEDRIYYSLIVLTGVLLTGYFLPLNYFTLGVVIFLSLYIFYRPRKPVLLETIYISLLLGVLAGRIGLLN